MGHDHTLVAANGQPCPPTPEEVLAQVAAIVTPYGSAGKRLTGEVADLKSVIRTLRDDLARIKQEAADAGSERDALVEARAATQPYLADKLDQAMATERARHRDAMAARESAYVTVRDERDDVLRLLSARDTRVAELRSAVDDASKHMAEYVEMLRSWRAAFGALWQRYQGATTAAALHPLILKLRSVDQDTAVIVKE